MELAVDIETVPTRAALAKPYDAETRQPPANYRDPHKIAQWRADDEMEWRASRIKQYSLDPLQGRVVAIGYAKEDVEPWADLAYSENDEVHVLQSFWNRVNAASVIVTWNGLSFDIPYLIIRSAINGVTVPKHQLLRRYDTRQHVDVKALVCQWDNYRMKQTTLDPWLAAFGIPVKSGHGSQVWPMVMEGQWDELASYAANDAAATLALYQRVASSFL
jgi:predicted PolB exonuclease-like 3'-5' exonuclease